MYITYSSKTALLVIKRNWLEKY